MTTPMLARPAHRRSEVGPIELFFDLVYVFAIIQLSHLLIEHLTWEGAAQTLIVFFAIWWGWNYTAWALNWLDPSRTSVQLFVGVLMMSALGMSAAIPEAFGEAAWYFVGCYLFMGVVRPLFVIFAHRGQTLAHNFRMLLSWTLFAGVFWVAGAALEEWRMWLWLLAVILDYAAPMVDFRIPGVGSAPMKDWETDAEHLAERNRLVFIIALGESILLMGGIISGRDTLTPGLALSFLVGFASLFVLWWNYFALAGPETGGGDSSTGALRSAYAYAHSFMVLGAILVAVSIELRLTHDHLTPAMILVAVGGPLAYLVGNVLFLRSRFGSLAQSRFVAAGVLVLIAVLAFWVRHDIPVIVLSLAVLSVTGGLAILTSWNRRSHFQGARQGGLQG